MGILDSMKTITMPVHTASLVSNSGSSSSSKDTGYFSNGYQANQINGTKLQKTGVTVADTGMAGTVNVAGKNIDDQNVWTTGNGQYYVWIGDGKGFGFYVQIGKNMFNNTERGTYDFTNYKDTNLSGLKLNNVVAYTSLGDVDVTKKLAEANKNTGSGSSSSNKISAPSIPNYDDSALRKQIEDMQKQIAELTKVYSAEELAERYGIDINEQTRLNDYNKQTNQYYDDMIREQGELRDDTLRNNSYYDQRLLENYNDSFQNSVHTQTGEAAKAATALSMMNTNAYNTGYNDYQLLQSLNNLEEARKKELAENVFTAKKDVTDLKTYLSSLSATHNASDVQNYVNELNALGSRYASSRATAAAAANAAATQYAGLANASYNYSNSAAGNMDSLYNYYLRLYNNEKQAASAVVNQMSTSTGGTGLSSRYAY